MKRISLVLALLALLVNTGVIRSQGPWKIFCDYQEDVRGYFVSLNGGPVFPVPSKMVILSDGSKATLLAEVPEGYPVSIAVVSYNYWGCSEPAYMFFTKPTPWLPLTPKQRKVEV